MRKLVVLMVVSALGLVFAAHASAANFYVAPGGTGTGAECMSPATPCGSVSEVITFGQQEAAEQHWINVAAVDDNGDQAVYEESIAIVPGPNTVPFVIFGNWRGSGAQRARFYAPAASVSNPLLLVNQGSIVHNIEIDGSRTNVTAVSATAGPGTGGFALTGVYVKPAPGSLGILAGGLSSFELTQVTVEADQGRALDLQGVSNPTVSYSTFSSNNPNSVISLGGPTGLELYGTAVFAHPEADNAIHASFGGGTVRIESSLVVGGKKALEMSAGYIETEIRSSTIDAGKRFVADANAQAIAWTPGHGPMTGSITGSILVEQPRLPETGSSAPSSVACSNTDVPNSVQYLDNGTRTLDCATGVDGNTHTAPNLLFYRNLPGAAGYTPRADSPAIDSGEYIDGQGELDVLWNYRFRAGRSCEGVAIIDRGAIEASCDNPGFKVVKLAKKKVKKGKKAKVKVRTNVPVRIDVKAGKAKAKQAIGKWKAGTNTLTLKTKKLKARKKPYKVTVTITAANGVSLKATVNLKVKK